MKKILVLAFVSAAFLFSCSADGDLGTSITPPEWKGGPASTPSTPGGGGGGGKNYCIIYYYSDDCDCYSMEGVPEEYCNSSGGELSNTCPNICFEY